MKKKITWVFIFQIYGKFWSNLLGHFIKHKPLISEEWVPGRGILFKFLKKGLLLERGLLLEHIQYVVLWYLFIIFPKKVFCYFQIIYLVPIYLPFQLALIFIQLWIFELICFDTRPQRIKLTPWKANHIFIL